MSRTLILGLTMGLVGTLSLPFGGSARAQEGSSVLEEVVVTARRREESLQDVPLSVAAFGFDDLELNGIEEIEDLTSMVPNVVLIGSELTGTSNGASDPARFTMRGLPGVGVYVDGVWDANNTNNLTSGIVDVERIEVLRGPQGTLFGKNTMGGAIQIVTARPSDEFGARIKATVGSDNRRDISASVDIPLSDTVFTRWTAAGLNRDGYVESVLIDQDYGDTEQTVVRGDILWAPSEEFSLRLIVENDEISQNGIPRITSALTEGSDPNTPICAQACAYNIVANAGTNPLIGPITNATHVAGFPGGQLGEYDNRMIQTLPGFGQDADRLTLDINWGINDALSFRSITGVREMDRKLALDFDGTEYNMLQQNQLHRDEQTTQELQLLGSTDRVSWVVGAFYWDEDSIEYQMRYSATEFAGRSPAGIPGNAPCINGVYPNVQPTGDFAVVNAAVPCHGFIPNTPSLELHGSDGIAIFGEATIALSDQLDLTVGLRQTDETRREARFRPALPQPSSPDVFPAGDAFATAATFIDAEDDFDATTGRISLQYRWNDEVMGYVSYSEGFNAGRINAYTPPFFAPAFILPIREETVETIEVGFKAELLDNSLRVNAAVFANDFADIHAGITTLANGRPIPLQTFLNVGEASADGAELDLSWIVTENWRIDVGVGLLDTAYESVLLPTPEQAGLGFSPNFFTVNTEFPLAPDLTYTLGIQYQTALANGGSITSRLQYGWNDDYKMHPNDNITFIQESYGLLNFRLNYDSPDDRYRFTLFGDNLTDEFYLLSGFSTENLGVALNTAGRPRQVGAELMFFLN